jgi:hypothetical protein
MAFRIRVDNPRRIGVSLRVATHAPICLHSRKQAAIGSRNCLTFALSFPICRAMHREFLPELEALLDLCGRLGTTEQAAEKHNQALAL